MKKTYLKLLIPIIALYFVVGVTCYIFHGIVRREITINKLNSIAHIAEENLNSVDVLIQTVVDYNDATAVSFANMDFYDDREKIVSILKGISQNESVQGSIVCTVDGKGYNEKGVNIDLTKEQFFADVLENYSNGGRGMTAVIEDGVFPVGSVAVVNYINFGGNTKGFLITASKVDNIDERIFNKIPPMDLAVLTELNGIAYAGDFEGGNLWESSQYDLPVDTIKLNISQKKFYTARIDGLGDIVVIPSKQTNGGVILLASDKNMAGPISNEMRNFYSLVATLFIVVTVYIVVNLFILSFGGLLKKIKATKENDRIKTDQITGLYNEVGFATELSGYTRYAGDRNGILFAISIECDNSTDRIRIINDVAEKLKNTYRLTDILGRGDDGAFLIFLKGFDGEKDIRKQTDELQLFLYDLKSALIEDEKDVNISAGRAIYPKNGGNVEELLSAVRGALEQSKAEGRGSISFCK